MILLLDTSTPTCKLTLITDSTRYDDEWSADRQLAKGLLAYLRDQLKKHDLMFTDVTGLGVFTGPGSFTGLRIGITVLNTLADSENIPIVGVTGDSWQDDAVVRLKNGENDQVVLPYYGAEAHITAPKK